jgi:hypothetical protein
VTNFRDWAVDDQRKPGDTGLVETEYGYHVMYYVGKGTEPSWVTTLRGSMQSEKYNEYYTAAAESYPIKEEWGMSYTLKAA